MATVVAVVGTIAGAGTTTVVTALGTALGEQRRRAALVDATAEGSRLTDSIEVAGGGEVTDAVRRGTAVGDVQADGPHDVAAFPADPETNWGAIRPNAVAELYDQLRDRFEFVIVDCGDSPSTDRAAWLGHADEVVIVTDPDVAGAVPDIAALADTFDVPVRGVLASRVPPKEVGDAVETLEGTDQAVLGVLPEDPTVGAAAKAGASVLRTEPDSPIATCAWELGLRFRQRDHDDPVVPAGTGPRSTPGSEPATAEAGSDGTETEESAAEPPAADADADATATSAADHRDSDDSEAPAADAPASSTADEAPSSTTDAPVSSSSSDGFQTLDPQPVEEDDSPSDHDVADHEPTDRETAGDDGADPVDGRSAGGTSRADPAEAAAHDGIDERGSARDPGRGSEHESGRDSTDEALGGIGRLDLGLSSDDGGTIEEKEEGTESTPGERSRETDPDERSGEPDPDAGIGGLDGGNSGDDGDSEGAESDKASAELSDEEIESVFQETMQRVTERREREKEAEDE